MNMSSYIVTTYNGNGGASQDGEAPRVVERYFDDNGKLLPVHYPEVYEQIAEAAKRYGKDISFLDQGAAIGKRVSAAKIGGWTIGACYNRCSTDMQDSYLGQIGRCIDRAIQNDIMIFPEYIAGDEGKTGKAGNRVGLNTVKFWIVAKQILVIVAFSVSRWFRSLHKGLAFIKEDVVERGVRAIAIAENVDTADKQWDDILTLNLFLAQKQVSAHPEFVRMGQRPLIENGFLVGACPLGFRPVPVPEAGTTKRGKAKTRPEIVPEVADLIRRSFERVAGGVTISQACRLYNQEAAELPEDIRKFAVDPRSTSKVMRPEAFRKLLVNERVIGKWSFGKLRNTWKDGTNSTVQEAAPEHEVITVVREEWRIVSDELFYAVQKKLAEGTRGRHGPRTTKETPLSTLLVSLFRCSECGRTFYHYGRPYMNCPESRRGGCGNWGTVTRETATQAIIAVLREQVLANPELVAAVVRHSRRLDAEESRDDMAERIVALEKAIKRQNAIMRQIELSCGDEGMDEDDQVRHKAAKSEKSRLQAELAGMKARSEGERRELSVEDVQAILKEFDVLLADAGAGKLGADGKQRAAMLIRSLVGGVIEVSFTKLQGRRAFGVGKFTPHLALSLIGGSVADGNVAMDVPEITVPFRELPRYARIADEVYRLRTEKGFSFTKIGERLDIGSGNAWGAFAYWHASRGLEVPFIRKQGRKNSAS
jgi:hypothetical protein